MLELKGEDIRSSVDHIDETIFEPFINNMPSDRGDRLAHHKNFEAMLKTVDSALQGCGPRGCSCKSNLNYLISTTHLLI